MDIFNFVYQTSSKVIVFKEWLQNFFHSYLFIPILIQKVLFKCDSIPNLLPLFLGNILKSFKSFFVVKTKSEHDKNFI